MFRILNQIEGSIGKRKLIVCFGVVIILAIAFLYYESIYNLNNRFKPFSSLTTNKVTHVPSQINDKSKLSEKLEILKDNKNHDNIARCWDTEKYAILNKCSKCDSFSLTFLHSCKETGYKEVISCEKYGTVSRSCAVPDHVISKRYWSFEFICLVLTAVSSSFVINRKRFLDKQALERMRQQISN